MANAQERPFKVVESITSSTTWYKMKMKNGFLKVYKNYNSYGVSVSNEDSNDDDMLWAFIKNGDKGFKIVNKSLDPTYQMYHSGDTYGIHSGDYVIMERRNGNTFYWKMTKSGISGLYAKSLFNMYIRSGNGVVFDIDPEYVEFIEYGSDEDIQKLKEAKLAEEKRIAEEREAAKRAQNEAKKAQADEFKKYIVGSWTYSDAKNTTTETFYANGTMKTEIIQNVKDGNKVIVISSSFTGTYDVSEDNLFTFYPNENSFKWKINKMSGLTQAEMSQVRNMDYRQLVYLGQNLNKATVRDANTMIVENIRSGVYQTYKRVKK